MLCVCLYYWRTNHVEPSLCKGTYISNLDGVPYPNMPSSIDTLDLLPNGVLKSDYYGEGRYHIYQSISGTYIEWNYDKGNYGFNAKIKRLIFKKSIVIEMDTDLEFYYVKQ